MKRIFKNFIHNQYCLGELVCIFFSLPSVPVFGAPDGSLPVSIAKAMRTDTAHSTPEPAFQSIPVPPAVPKMEIAPPLPASTAPSLPGHDAAAEKMTPTPSPSLSPSPSPTPSPLPPPKTKSVAVSRALSPARPIKLETKKEVKYTTPHDEAKEKPAVKEIHITTGDNPSKIAATSFQPPPVPSSLHFPRYQQRPPPPLQPPGTPPRMPQLHRMSPITPSSPPASSPLHLRAAPTLSPLTKTPPYLFTNPPLRPVLHRFGRTLSDPPRGELTRRPSDTAVEPPILPPPGTISSDPSLETAPVYAPQPVQKIEQEEVVEDQKSPADVEIYLSPSPANSESSASLSTSLSPVPSHESSPVKPSSPVRPPSQTGFVLATDTVLSPSSPILHSPTTSLSSSSSFSSSSLSLPPEIQTKSTFEPEYPEVSKDLPEPFMQSLPEPILSESSNESDSDSSVEYPPVGGLGKGQGIHSEEPKHILEYPDMHKDAQAYTDHPVLERKRSFSPSSESSIESVPKQPLKVSISRLKIDGQTSYAVQPSPKPPKHQPMVTHLSPTSDPAASASSGLQVSSSSYQKVRSIRLSPSARPGLTVSMPKVVTPRLEPPPASLMVSVLRRNLHLGKFRLTPSPVSEESVRVTIPKSIFMSEKRVKKTSAGRKRERESVESELKIPKKVVCVFC